MKNKIQIMFVRGLQKALNHDNGPRLPRHWKVIASTLLLLFTLGIGNVWGTNPSDTVTVHSPGKIAKTNLATAFGRKYETFFSDNASLTNLLVGSNTSSTNQASGENKWCCIGTSCGNTSNSISTGFTNEEFVCNAKTSNHKALRVQSIAQTAKIITMVVSGYDSIATLDKDEVQVYAEEYGTSSYGSQSKLTAVRTKTVSSHNKRVYALNASKRYRLTIAYNTSGSTNKTLYAFSLCVPGYAATQTLSHVTRKSGDIDGTKAATKGYAYNVTFEAEENYALPSSITVTIGGSAAEAGTDYTWNSTTGEFNVPANKVTGAIVVAIEGEISGTPCSATANAGADKNTTVGVGVAMAATAAGEGYTGAWSIKAGSPSTATSQLGTTSSNTMTFTPNTYGTYTLVWTVTDNNDGTCSDSDEATVTVPAPTHGILYTNLKGMDNSANPTSYSEGTGVASFAKLRHAVGYDFTGWSPSSISSSATTDQTINAQWTANAVAEGSGSLTYALAFGSGTITTSSITRVNGALYDATDVSVAHTSFDDNANKNGCSGKLHTTSAKDDANYVELTFKVADGYTFTPTEVSVRANAVSTAKTLEVELKDNAATPNSKSVTGALDAGSTDGGATVTLDFDASGEVALEGTVTAKIFVYGATNAWRLGTSIVISGTVASSTPPSCSAPASPTISGETAYTEGGNISLTASATGTDGSTNYTWYKGADWATASAGSSVGSAATLAINGCSTSDAGTYWCNISNGTGCEVQVSKTITVAAAPVCPSGLSISGTKDYTAGQTISLEAALEAGNGEITYNWYKGDDLATAKAAGSIGTGASFSKASCATSDAGNYFCVASKDGCLTDAESSAYAVTVAAAPAPCFSFVPDAKDESVTVEGSSITTCTGGTMVWSKGGSNSSTLAYDATYGLLFGGSGSCNVIVTLNHLMQENTEITVTIVADPKDDSNRGLLLRDGTNSTNRATWTWKPAANKDEKVFTYKVTSGDGLIGTNVFRIFRSTNAYIKSLTVSNCGDPLYALSSAVTPAHDPAYATVTLSKTLIAAGGTATATYSAIDPAYDFDEWVVSGATIDDAKANPVTITMGSTDAVVTLKLKAASIKHTVTYYDGEAILANKLGEELIEHNDHPTGAGLAPRKLGYTFGGWSTTEDGAAATLSDINVTADMPLYAVWNAVNCATKSGTIYTMSISVAPAANCTITSTTGTHDLYQYEGVSGGEALLGNKGTSNNCILQTNKKILLKDDNSYIKLDFDCPLKEGDKIVYSVESNNPVVSTGNSKPSTPLATLDRTKTEFVIPAESGLIDAQTIYIWKGGGNTTVTYINIVRPAKYAVTFNMHGHGDQVAQQDILEGGKVSEPATTDITGWDFGGWYKTYVADPESYSNPWDFDDDVVEAATVLHAKWTAHVASNDVALGTLSVNGEAITIVPSQLVYAVELPFGTTAVPAVTATANDENVKAFTITQALAVDGSATIYVKAEDNTTEATYTINFSVATSKDIELVWDKSKKRCDDTNPEANVKSDDASVSAYINKITFTGGGEGSSLNVGTTAGNMFTLSAKAGYAFQAMSFFGKIQDATCEYSLDGGAWTELASTKTDGDKCYANIFSAAEVHEFRLRSTGTSGVWIRNMQLTIVEACTPIVLAWDEEPVEFEVGKSGYAIAATTNNSGAVTYSSTDGDVIAVNGSTGALTVSALGSVTLKAATAEGDGTAYCANSGNDIEISKAVNTYYLVTFDAQNGDAADEVKYYSGDAAIALPAAPTYSGYDFQGWFNAETGGTQYTEAITPAASMSVYAQWQAQCDGATITTQPTGASYLTGRTPAALVCEATAGAGGALTYEWFTCDDALKTNPVAATAMPSTAVAGTFYYFCKVTEAGCDVEAFSDVVTITVADKDGICIIKSTPTSGTEATVDGVYQGNAFFTGRESDKKLNSKYHNVGVQLKEGYTFLATDKVVLNQTVAVGTDDLKKFYVFYEAPADGKTYATVTNASPVQGDNWFAMPAEIVGHSSLYVGRVDANCNPSVGYLAVYRACAPILNKVTVNGTEGTPDNTNHIAIEVPFSTTQTQLEAIAYDWVSNNDAWTAAHAPVAANAWEFGVENTVTFTDKDGDASEYYITISKAVASSDATLSALTVNGQAIALADGVFEYSFELPYGTTVAPTVEATPNHVAAVATVDPCTLSGATITVVPESGAGDQKVYTLTFTISAWKDVAIWDGSTMSAVATSPDATGLAWEVNGFGSISNYNTTCGEKSYTKVLPSGGSVSASRNITLTVPAGYVAKFYVVMASHSDGNERGMFIGSNLVKDPDATSVLQLSNNDRDVAVAGMSEIVGAGTWYINPNNSIDFQEIRAYVRKGMVRNSMLGDGVLGTSCVDHNVAIEDIQGATFYELMGRDYTNYGKLAFDEIVSGELEAGVPYVFQAHGDKLILFYGEDVEPAPVDKGNGMYGTFEQIVLTELDDVYYFAQRALWSCDGAETLTVAANRAYVKLSEIGEVPSSNPAPGRRRITMNVNGEKIVTGMENLNASEQPVKLLINGQIFIIRGEKMFDATGRLVK